jgi:hypothetical protein
MDIHQIAYELQGTPGTVAGVPAKLDMEYLDPDDVIESLLGINIERCLFCDWWFESHELVDGEGEFVGCDQCRADKGNLGGDQGESC